MSESLPNDCLGAVFSRPVEAPATPPGGGALSIDMPSFISSNGPVVVPADKPHVDPPLVQFSKIQTESPRHGFQPTSGFGIASDSDCQHQTSSHTMSNSTGGWSLFTNSFVSFAAESDCRGSNNTNNNKASSLVDERDQSISTNESSRNASPQKMLPDTASSESVIGGADGEVPPVCRHFLLGRCNRRRCRFLHPGDAFDEQKD
eukprot:PhF_6_TR686/c0_g2_i1/m.1063